GRGGAMRERGKWMESCLDGYDTNSIMYTWCKKEEHGQCEHGGVKVEQVELPTYSFAKRCPFNRTAVTLSGAYDRLGVTFVLDRSSGFYMLQIFVPAGLVVAISWVSFWISRDSPPSRTVIGVMTVLTETHLMTGTNRRLPPVAYVKAVDVYLGFCYLLVVLALIEYACVAYSKKKNEDRKRRESKLKKGPPSPPQPDLIQDARLARCTCADPHEPTVLAVVRQPFKWQFCLKHSHIDMASRLLFPSSFFLFNIIFWLVLLHKAERLSFFSSAVIDRCSPSLN
ncbi:hypothetical protein PMAYCL1PPCAC_12252, partial [Pristionchus mayeri]